MEREAGELRISYRIVAIAAVVLSLTSAAVLAVVASIKAADVLATVALALAVLAFVVQLVVFVVQAAASNTQMLQAQDIFGRMQQLLAHIEERSAGTQAVVSRIEDRLLDAIVAKKISESQPLREVDVADRAREIALGTARATAELDVEGRSEYPPAPADDVENRRIRRQLLSWPGARRGREAVTMAEPLEAAQLFMLGLLSLDEIRARAPSAVLGPGLRSTDGPADLLGRGLVTTVPGYPNVYVLTPVGRTVARLLTAHGEPPAYVSDKVRALREELPQPTITKDDA